MQRDEAALLDIYQAALRVLDYTAGFDREMFLEVRETQASVMYELAIIGEAARRLSSEFRHQHTVVPWRQIVGMRNVVIHQYNSIDLDEVWKVVDRDLPRLIVAIEPLLPKEDA